ncbi:hypothetical protein SPF06_19675 [Sinomonas sp. JGH33]|uniref:Uncharacterized protein n=1 Tax=Sinomonas terricola TaxID=3110330 RepID=A0ABU5TB75_9MICC|nr:hypothetical protein [Sinomonas sp. JGH33]MEA5456948.1 hypothetical protein [Sinomonas sp. JGH33]
MGGSIARLTDGSGRPLLNGEVDVLASLAIGTRCMELIAMAETAEERERLRSIAEDALSRIAGGGSRR